MKTKKQLEQEIKQLTKSLEFYQKEVEYYAKGWRIAYSVLGLKQSDGSILLPALRKLLSLKGKKANMANKLMEKDEMELTRWLMIYWDQDTNNIIRTMLRGIKITVNR